VPSLILMGQPCTRYMEAELLPLLEPGDGKDAVTYANIIMRAEHRIHEGHINYLCDKLTGDVPHPKHNYTLIDGDNLAAQVTELLIGFAKRDRALPACCEAFGQP
jgi:hypothetical protein